MERSFADAANNHHFKRARWRRLWRQQIQDYLIAAIQNVRILLAHQNPKPSAAVAVSLPASVIDYNPALLIDRSLLVSAILPTPTRLTNHIRRVPGRA
jgi:hypothetical protein